MTTAKARQWAVSLLLGLAAVVLIPGGVQAESQQYVEPMRYWPAEGMFESGEIRVSGEVDGVTVLWNATDADATAGDDGCEIAVADDRRALAHIYRHDYLPTRCVDVVAHPDGGLFVRGEFDAGGPHPDEGTTTRIGGGGEVVWSVADERLRNRTRRPDGPGEFQGDYAGPLEGMAYDPEGDHLVGLAVGEESLVGDRVRQITQAHVIDGQSGDVEFVGQSFGTFGAEEIVDVTARDGEFLLATVDRESSEPAFYSFRTDGRLQLLEPGEIDWSDRRIVAPVNYRSSVGTVVLWESEDEDDRSVGLTRIEGLDSVVFDQQFDPAEVAGVHELQAPSAVRGWIGETTAAVLYRGPGGGEQVQLVELETGAEPAVVDWREEIEYEPVGVAVGDDGRLVAVAFDGAQGVVWEYEFRPEGVDAESVPQLEDGDEAGGCSQSGGPAVPVWMVWFVIPAKKLSCRHRRRIFPASLPSSLDLSSG